MNVHAMLKAIHITCATLSIAGFLLRYAWCLSGRSLPRQGWRRWLPHINDTVLLAAGVGLMVVTSQYPGANDWLTAKLLGLIAYVYLGRIALSASSREVARRWAGPAALLAVGYVVSVALTRNPAGYFAMVWAG